MFLFVVITILSYCLPSCSSNLSIFHLTWFDTSLYYRRVQSLQSKVHRWRVDILCCEDSRYLLKYMLWRHYPLVEIISTSTMFKSCTLRRHLLYLDLDVIRLFYFSSLLCSANSPNATTLHSCCIWEAVLR